MTGFLLDTNVASEISRAQPDTRVLDWFGSVDNDLLYLSEITLGEIRTGIDRLPEANSATF